MALYQMANGHKHWIYGQLYKGKGIDGRTEGDMLELTEEQAGKIEGKLQGGPRSAASTEEAKGIPKPHTPTLPSTSEDVKSFEDIPEEETVKDPKEENLRPELRHLREGKWNVVRGDKPMNDSPMSLDEAKSMIAGMEV